MKPDTLKIRVDRFAGAVDDGHATQVSPPSVVFRIAAVAKLSSETNPVLASSH